MTRGLRVDDCRGDWALVTGASAGLGQEFARHFAAAGMNVAMVARRHERLDALAAELRAAQRVDALALPIDLSRPDAIRSIRTTLAARAIRVRILCNNAAFGHWGGFDRVSEDAYARMVQVNALAIASLCRASLDDLRSFPGSAIINVASGAAFQPVPYMAVYAATKAFVHSFGLALHAELGDAGIVVQTLVPGPTATEFDSLAGAPSALVGRGAAADVVRYSFAQLATGVALAAQAKGVFKQRAFAGLAPIPFVLKTVEKMFRPTGPNDA